jgi:N-acetylglutamate synthase-like GNAT family acetyltransferase
MVNIIAYRNQFARDFYELNVEWLKTYFYVEPYDEAVLSEPQTYILDKGGFIFLAQKNNTIIGTYALMPLKDSTGFELTKMAVHPEYRNLKIGQQLLTHCINFAKNQDFESLVLYSSRKLENAIYIYKKIGFIEIPVEANCNYKRCDIKMQYFNL